MGIISAFIPLITAIVAAVAAPMANIGNITMYGEGNTAKLTGDVTKTMKQITDGFTDATGFNPMMLLSGVLGGKLAASNNGSTVNVHVDGDNQ